jgi:hypothetical protein
MATWSIQLSPGGAEIVTALPAMPRVGLDRPHPRRQEAGAPLRLVHRGHASRAQAGDDGGVGAVDVLDDDGHGHSFSATGGVP